MDILALTHRCPFPPDRGDRVRSWHLLSRLAQDHRVWLACVDDHRPDLHVAEQLDGSFHRWELGALPPWVRRREALASLLRHEPLSLGWFRHRRLMATVRAWAQEQRFDAAFVFSSSMGPYWQQLEPGTRPPAVVDFIDVDSEKWSQYARAHRLPRRWIYTRERGTLARYEERLAGQSECALLVSEREAQLLRPRVDGIPVEALNLGVDTGWWSRPDIQRPAEPPRIIFTGRMDYGPNVDAAEWAAREVLPRVRQAVGKVELAIVGAAPDPRVKALASLPGVTISGWVEDVRPWMWGASVALAPMRIAQGVQTKVLEAMAAGVPVVLTSMAASGLGEESGPHLGVADDAAGLAALTIALLQEPAAARAQAQAALAMVARHHSCDRAARELEGHLESVSAGREELRA